MDMSSLMKYTSLNMTFPDSTEKEKEPVERERTDSQTVMLKLMQVGHRVTLNFRHANIRFFTLNSINKAPGSQVSCKVHNSRICKLVSLHYLHSPM